MPYLMEWKNTIATITSPFITFVKIKLECNYKLLALLNQVIKNELFPIRIHIGN